MVYHQRYGYIHDMVKRRDKIKMILFLVISSLSNSITYDKSKECANLPESGGDAEIVLDVAEHEAKSGEADDQERIDALCKALAGKVL